MLFDVIWIGLNSGFLLMLAFLNGLIVAHYEEVWWLGQVTLPAMSFYLLEIVYQVEMIREDRDEK